MARWSGKVGFFTSQETSPGVWEEVMVEKQYYGDLLKNYKTNKSGDSINDSIDISNQISFVADPYANNNFYAIRYAYFRNTKWKVTSVDVEYPRLILSLGGVYNGN